MNDPASGLTAPAVARGMMTQLAQWRRDVRDRNLRLGWKIGFNDRAAQQRAGLATPATGFLSRDRQLATGGVYRMPPGAVIKAEVEIALCLARNVPAGATLDAAEAAIAACAPAIEIVDVSHPLEGIEAILGGNLYQAAVLIGPEQRPAPVLPREVIRAQLRDGGQLLRTSEAQRLPERLGQLVQVVADTLAAHGEQLTAGDWIICGSMVEPLPVVAGMRLEVEMPPFAPIRLDIAVA